MLRASYHQGHARYKASGKQCVANSIQSMITALSFPPSKWTQSTLDQILQDGDKLYEELTYPSGVTYLSCSDLPANLCGLDLCLSEPLHGTICRNVSDPPFFSLDEALKKLDPKECDATYLFTMGANVPAYSCSILKTVDTLYFFDPHSRDNRGMAAADGVACMTVHKSSKQLCQFIRALAQSLIMVRNTPFEITQVHLSTDSSDSDFSGFSLESEGDVACRLFLADEAVKNVEISDVSEISSVDIGDFDQGTCTSDSEPELSLGASETEDAVNSQNVMNDVSFEICSDDSSSKYSEDIPLLRLKEKYCSASEDSDENIPLIRLKDKQCGSNSFTVSESSLSTRSTTNRSFSDPQSPSAVSPLVVNGGTNESSVKICSTRGDPDEDENQERGRKRKRNFDHWKRNVAKRRYNEGKTYVDRFGNFRSGKKIKPGCGKKCRYKCHAKNYI